MNLEGKDKDGFNNLNLADKWILGKLNSVVKEVEENFKNFRIGEVAHILYDFFWNDYCDWYIELSKIQKNEAVLSYVLDMTLRLLHPIMPHITEEIWGLMDIEKEKSAIMISDYPKYKEEFNFEVEKTQMESVLEAIKALRNLRASFGIPVTSLINLKIMGEKSFWDTSVPYLKRFGKVEDVEYLDAAAKIAEQSSTIIVGDTKFIVPLAGLIDIEQEIAKQNNTQTPIQSPLS
jgi:valyl-tRNA synthetase